MAMMKGFSNAFRIPELRKKILITLGLVFVFVGVLRGEPGMILQKAIRICLECIGIG